MKNVSLFFVFNLFTLFLFSQSPVLLDDLNSGPGDGISEWQKDIFIVGDRIIWIGQSDQNGTELYASENGNTQLLLDVNPGAESSDPIGLTYFKGFLYFAATGMDGNEDIYRTDGTAENTEKVIDLDGFSNFPPRHMIVSGNGDLYFTNNTQLFISDGTQAGTRLIENVPANFYVDFNRNSPNFSNYNGGIVFFKEGSGNLFEIFEAHNDQAQKLFSFQGTSFFSDIHGLNPVEGGFIFVAEDDDTSVEGIYKYEMGQSEPSRFSEHRPSRLKAFGSGKFLFPADGGTYVTDGTASGTKLLIDTQVFPSAGDKYIAENIGNEIVFLGGGGSFAGDLNYFISNGKLSGTQSVLNEGKIIGEMVKYGDQAFWIVDVQGNRKPIIFTIGAGQSEATQLYQFPEELTSGQDIILMGADSENIFFQSNLDDGVGRELYSLDHNLEITSPTENFQKFDYKILHNRSDAKFMVQIPQDEKDLKISILDISGRLISSQTVENNIWQTLPKVAGIFVITVQGTQGRSTQLLIQN